MITFRETARRWQLDALTERLSSGDTTSMMVTTAMRIGYLSKPKSIRWQYSQSSGTSGTEICSQLEVETR